MHFDYRLLVFKTVAEKMSFTRAAKELFTSQPSVTNHIKELEKEVGAALFDRLGNKIHLTEAGKLLYGYAEKIASLYKQFDEKISEMKNINSGNLRIGASTTISQFILPKILASYKSRFPSIAVTLSNGNSAQIETLLTNKKIDIGVIEGNSNLPEINYENFLNDEIVLVISAQNRLIQKGEISLDELKSIPLVIRESGSGTLDVIDSALSKHNMNRNSLMIEMQLGSTASIIEYLKFSDSAAFISINAIQNELMRNELRIIEIENFQISRTFQFITLIGNHSNLITHFKSFSKRAAT
jgi:DNA-binding transcriptional LysR family regulator